MTSDELREMVANIVRDVLNTTFVIPEDYADRILSLEPIASALALKRDVDRMKLGHSTGDR